MALGAVLRCPAEHEFDRRGVGFATKTIVAEAARRTSLAIAQLAVVERVHLAHRGARSLRRAAGELFGEQS